MGIRARAQRWLVGAAALVVVALASGSGCSAADPSAGGGADARGAAGSPDHGGASGGASSDGSASADGSSGAGAGSSGGGDASADGGGGQDSSAAVGACQGAGLVWRTANKTTFESYPAPGSPECVDYNGCAYQGQFAACSGVKPLSWVQTHDIVAVFPHLHQASNGIAALALHDLCLKAGSKTLVVTVIDACADSDCSGCCTANKGGADELIDLEKFTDARFGVPDGPIQWADLGPTKGQGCQ